MVCTCCYGVSGPNAAVAIGLATDMITRRPSSSAVSSVCRNSRIAIVGRNSSPCVFVTIPNVGPGRRPVITVDWEESERSYRLRIADNGIGIAPDNRDRIFRMFERAHNAQGYEGTGIGLAIVRKAMDRIGGRVSVESKLDQGSRFILDFRKP